MSCDHLKEYREHIVEARRVAFAEYDALLVKLAGGALGISFAFVDRLVDLQAIENVGVLFWGWVALVFSLACTLISHLTSHEGLSEIIDLIDSSPKELGENTPYMKATKCLNYLSGLSFIGGVVLIAVFVRINLVEENKMFEKENPQIEGTSDSDGGNYEKGYVAPPPPPPVSDDQSESAGSGSSGSDGK